MPLHIKYLYVFIVASNGVYHMRVLRPQTTKSSDKSNDKQLFHILVCLYKHNGNNLVLVHCFLFFYKIIAIQKRMPLSGHPLGVSERSALANLNVLHQGFLLLLGELGQRDAQDAVFHLGSNFLFLHVLGQAK